MVSSYLYNNNLPIMPEMKRKQRISLFGRARLVVAFLFLLTCARRTSGFVAHSTVSHCGLGTLQNCPIRLYETISDSGKEEEEPKQHEEEEEELQMSTVRIDDGGSDLTDRFKYKVRLVLHQRLCENSRLFFPQYSIRSMLSWEPL